MGRGDNHQKKVREKDQYEELVFALVAIYLSEYYAVALSKYNDSVNILKYIGQFVQSENANKIINETLNILMSSM